MKTSILIFAAIAILATNGCNTTQQSIAIKSEVTVVTTVDAGMKTWALYVNAGHATQQQVDAVHSAYDTYYNAQVIAEAALEKMVSTGSTNTTDVATASSAALAAQASLLSILNQYLTPTNH